MSKRLIYLLLCILAPTVVFGMHIAEGFLPVKWAVAWWIIYIPFLFAGIKRVKLIVSKNSSTKLLLAATGAFVFVLSSMKLPSVAGSSSHLTGVALGAIIFGASTMSVVGFITLLFQALLLAHGGLTTLGANGFSMAVCGAFVAVWVFKGLRRLKAPQWLTIFTASFLSNMVIYSCTSVQLALAFQSSGEEFWHNLIKFLSVFAVTQLPLAIIEGVFTIFVYRMVLKMSKEDVHSINPSLK